MLVSGKRESPFRWAVAVGRRRTLGAEADARFAAAILRHIRYLSAASLAISRPFFREEQAGFFLWQLDDIADAVRRHVYPINSVRELFGEANSHAVADSNTRTGAI
jgi:hypothetical protein